MAARLLRHVRAWSHASAATWAQIVPNVPASRAAVGKVIVTNLVASTVTVDIAIGSTVSNDMIAYQTSIAPGENYSEKGIIIPAGEGLHVRVSAAGSACAVAFFAEEVDN